MKLGKEVLGKGVLGKGVLDANALIPFKRLPRRLTNVTRVQFPASTP